jgi:hypothetical protein
MPVAVVLLFGTVCSLSVGFCMWGPGQRGVNRSPRAERLFLSWANGPIITPGGSINQRYEQRHLIVTEDFNIRPSQPMTHIQNQSQEEEKIIRSYVILIEIDTIMNHPEIFK